MLNTNYSRKIEKETTDGEVMRIFTRDIKLSGFTAVKSQLKSDTVLSTSICENDSNFELQNGFFMIFHLLVSLCKIRLSRYSERK